MISFFSFSRLFTISSALNLKGLVVTLRALDRVQVTCIFFNFNKTGFPRPSIRRSQQRRGFLLPASLRRGERLPSSSLSNFIGRPVLGKSVAYSAILSGASQ